MPLWTPVRASEVDPQPLTASTLANVTVATTATSALLAAPGAGTFYEIELLYVRTGAAVTATSAAIFKGHTTGTEFWGAAALNASVVNSHAEPKNFFLGEGLDVNNAALGVSILAAVVYRVVTQTSIT